MLSTIERLNAACVPASSARNPSSRRASALRPALLAGISLSGLASHPAGAAVTTHPGIFDDTAAANVSDELVITLAGDSSLFGVTATGMATALAIVNSPARGEIAQVGNAFGPAADDGFLDLLMDNHGTATVRALASADYAAGTATARARAARGIIQNGNAEAGATLDIVNDGALSVIAEAKAQGLGALALATLATGVLQDGFGSTVDMGIVNDGTITLLASAEAIGSMVKATAAASAIGIKQHAFAQHDAHLSLDNDGTIAVGALAHAVGSATADADAVVIVGIDQQASGADALDGFASAAIANDGTVSVAMSALATAELHAHAVGFVDTAIRQVASGSGGGADVDFTNSGDIDLSVAGIAHAGNDSSRAETAEANVDLGGIVQFALAFTQSTVSGPTVSGTQQSGTRTPHGPVSIDLVNEGSITLDVAASATANEFAVAIGVGQLALQEAVGTSAAISFANQGDVSVGVEAVALVEESAQAIAGFDGLRQRASAMQSDFQVRTGNAGTFTYDLVVEGAGPATVAFANEGTIDIHVAALASASATAADPTRTFEIAGANAGMQFAVSQLAAGSEAQILFDNSGSISVAATAEAHGVTMAYAVANIKGIDQSADASGTVAHAQFSSMGMGSAYTSFIASGAAVASVQNDGTVALGALASATGDGHGYVLASALAVEQFVAGATADAIIHNVGSISVSAQGLIDQATFATAFVAAQGGTQVALAEGDATAGLVNEGSITINADLGAVAESGSVIATVLAIGFAQAAVASGEAIARFVNEGSLDVSAIGHVEAGIVGALHATAIGIGQRPLFGTLGAQFDNQGEISVVAEAEVDVANDTGAGIATGNAFALGYFAQAANLDLDIVNAGDFSVTARIAVAGTSGPVSALAVGLDLTAATFGMGGPYGEIGGEIRNEGSLVVLASASATNGQTLSAVATGISLEGGVIGATIVNSGSLSVEAVTGNGGPARATGFRAANALLAPTDPDAVLTFVNDGGDIIVRQSTDGGDSWARGMAIDVAGAPNPSVINLLGQGTITGHIAIKTGDSINVADGSTYFDGIINPLSLPPSGISGASLDAGLWGVGDLAIGGGGTLILADPKFSGDPAMYDGPAYAFVDTLSVASDGALGFELSPAKGGAQKAGTYAQVFAASASLDGTLVASLSPTGRLFADSYSWQNVIDSGSVDGEFEQCALGGDYAGSLFLDFRCTYDSGDNVDLSLTRASFASIGGLGRNALAVANGIETIYSPDLQGDFATLVGDLFRLDDADDYRVALEQLSGVAFADYLGTTMRLGLDANALVGRAIEGNGGAGSLIDRRGASPVRTWGTIDHGAGTLDDRGDSGAGGGSAATSLAAGAAASAGPAVDGGRARTRRTALVAGADIAPRSDVLIGIAAGHVSGRQRSSQFGDRIDFNGFQAGFYGAFDSGRAFAKASVNWAWLDGDSARAVDFTALGGSVAVEPAGDPDVNVRAIAVSAGLRFPAASFGVVSPYAGIDHVSTHLESFRETGGSGAGLTVGGSRESRLFATAGAKWTIPLARASISLDAAYRRRFGDRTMAFGATLNGDPAGAFTIHAAPVTRSSLLLGLTAGGKLGPFDASISYSGERSGDYSGHGGAFRLSLPLGGR